MRKVKHKDKKGKRKIKDESIYRYGNERASERERERERTRESARTWSRACLTISSFRFSWMPTVDT